MGKEERRIEEKRRRGRQVKDSDVSFVVISDQIPMVLDSAKTCSDKQTI